MKVNLTVTIDKTVCLLSHPSTDDDDTGTFVEASAESTKVLQGCHLYYYNVCKRYWIRSGKEASGKHTFCKRNDQHSKAARKPTTNQAGNFYQKFPDENVDVEGQLGTNQDLRLYCGFSFHPLFEFVYDLCLS